MYNRKRPAPIILSAMSENKRKRPALPALSIPYAILRKLSDNTTENVYPETMTEETIQRTKKGYGYKLECPLGHPICYRKASTTRRAHFAHKHSNEKTGCQYAEKYGGGGGESPEHLKAKVQIGNGITFEVECSQKCGENVRTFTPSSDWTYMQEQRIEIPAGFDGHKHASNILVDGLFIYNEDIQLVVEVCHTNGTNGVKRKYLQSQEYEFFEVKAKDVLENNKVKIINQSLDISMCTGCVEKKKKRWDNILKNTIERDQCCQRRCTYYLLGRYTLWNNIETILLNENRLDLKEKVNNSLYGLFGSDDNLSVDTTIQAFAPYYSTKQAVEMIYLTCRLYFDGPKTLVALAEIIDGFRSTSETMQSLLDNIPKTSASDIEKAKQKVEKQRVVKARQRVEEQKRCEQVEEKRQKQVDEERRKQVEEEYQKERRKQVEEERRKQVEEERQKQVDEERRKKRQKAEEKARRRNDPQFVLSNVLINGLRLQFASHELRGNKDVVTAAVTQNGGALKFASHELQDNEDVVTAAVTQNGGALKFASHELQDNEDVVTAAVTQNGRALIYVSDKLQLKLKSIAVQNNGLKCW